MEISYNIHHFFEKITNGNGKMRIHLPLGARSTFNGKTFEGETPANITLSPKGFQPVDIQVPMSNIFTWGVEKAVALEISKLSGGF